MKKYALIVLCVWILGSAWQLSTPWVRREMSFRGIDISTEPIQKPLSEIGEGESIVWDMQSIECLILLAQIIGIALAYKLFEYLLQDSSSS